MALLTREEYEAQMREAWRATPPDVARIGRITEEWRKEWIAAGGMPAVIDAMVNAAVATATATIRDRGLGGRYVPNPAGFLERKAGTCRRSRSIKQDMARSGSIDRAEQGSRDRTLQKVVRRAADKLLPVRAEWARRGLDLSSVDLGNG